MSELETLLARLPGAVLDAFRDESFTRNFRAHNQQLFLDTCWVDLDDLKSWLHAKHLSSYLLEDESSESIGVSSSGLSFLDQPPYGFDIGSFFQDSGFHDLSIDSSRTGSSTPSQASYKRRGCTQAGNGKIKELLKSQLAILVAEQKTSSSGVVRVRQKSKTSASSATLTGKGPVGGGAKGKGKQPQTTEVSIEPDDTEIRASASNSSDSLTHHNQILAPQRAPSYRRSQWNSGAILMQGNVLTLSRLLQIPQHPLPKLRHLHVGLHGSGRPPPFTQRRLPARLCRLNHPASWVPGNECDAKLRFGELCMTIKHIPASSSSPNSLMNTARCTARQNLHRLRSFALYL
ncbi:hypothetical protein C8R45DRAFT_1006465, partial [Mycena sanguinolenta]